MRQNQAKRLTQCAVIAALYLVLTLLSSVFGIAYGPVQFRLSEVLTLLPVLTPAAVPGLVIGCLLSNLWSPLGIVDIVFGTCATALAALWSRALRRRRLRGVPVLAALPPVLCNAVVVGLEIACLSESNLFSVTHFSLEAFLLSALSVGTGELAVCCVLGLPLLVLLERSRISRYLD